MLGCKWQKGGSCGRSHNQAGDCFSEVPDNNYTEELSIKESTEKVRKIKGRKNYSDLNKKSSGNIQDMCKIVGQSDRHEPSTTVLPAPYVLLPYWG